MTVRINELVLRSEIVNRDEIKDTLKGKSFDESYEKMIRQIVLKEEKRKRER